MKRILAVLLSMFMAFGNMPVDAHAESLDEGALATVDETEADAFVDDIEELQEEVNDEDSVVDSSIVIANEETTNNVENIIEDDDKSASMDLSMDATEVPEESDSTEAGQVQFANNGNDLLFVEKKANCEWEIADYLFNVMKLNHAAVVGALANINAESGFNPYALGDEGTSYGICQWHNSRWTDLKNYCANNGYDWHELDGQLHFLDYELKARKRTYDFLTHTPNTFEGALIATAFWCRVFENPANQSTQIAKRQATVTNTFWGLHGNGRSAGVGSENPWYYYEGKPTRSLEYKSPKISGGDVMWVQQALNVLVSAGLTVDGEYGTYDTPKVKQFQSQNGLSATGIVDSATVEKLVSALHAKGIYEGVASPNGTISYGPYNGVNYTNSGLSSERVAALDAAKRMVTIEWTAMQDFVTWCSSGGSYNTTVSTDGTSSTKFCAGKTYTGIPYSMKDHTYSESKWIDAVKNNRITTSFMQDTYYPHGKLTTAHGIDCSYFVYSAIASAVGTGKVGYQTTATMLNSSYYSRLGSIDDAIGGDVFLKNGHVMMYVGRSGSDYAVFEATAYGSRCVYNVYSKSKLEGDGYAAYRFTGWTGSDPCNCTTDYAGDYVVTTNSSPLTIRSGHGTGFSKIGEIPKGATCHVSKGDGTWAHVEYNGVNGYASMQYLARVSSSSTELDYRFKFPFSYQYRGERLFTYDAAGGARSGYVDDKDDCTVNEVYASGWTKVTFPNSSTGGTLTRYSTLTEFLGGGVNPVGGIAPQYADAYYDSARSARRGNVDAGDEIVKLREENGSTLVQYPVGSEWRCAWVETALLADPAPGSSMFSVNVGYNGNDTSFSWTASSNTDWYNLRIFEGSEDEVKNRDARDLSEVASLGTTELGDARLLLPGWYKAYVDSVKGERYTCSNQVWFNVPAYRSNSMNIEEGTYLIVSVARPDLALGIEDHGTWNNANIQLQPANQSDPYQKWRLKYEKDGFYRIWNDVTGMVVDGNFSNGFVAGMNIEMCRLYENNSNQLFSFVPVPRGEGYFIPVKSDYALSLDVSTGNIVEYQNIQLWETHTGDPQRFKLIRVDDKTDLGGIELGQASYEFGGYPVCPEPVVKDASGYVLRNGVDYVLSYENNTGTGTARVIALGIGAYRGSLSTDFFIGGLNLGDDFWGVIRTSLTDFPEVKYVGVSEDAMVVVDSARDDNYDSHLWHFVRRADGSYNLFTSSNRHEGKVMDNLGYYDYDGAEVIANVFIPDSTAEAWDIYREGDGYSFMPRYNRTRVLEVFGANAADGNRLCMSSISHSNAQKFYIDKILVSMDRTIADGRYNILASSDNGFGLTILEDRKENGANVHLWTYVESNPHFSWDFKYVGNGYYEIRNAGSGKNLDVDGAEIGKNVQQWDVDSDSRRQRWQVIPNKEGYTLVPESARHAALDVKDAVYANGTNIQIWRQHDNDAQVFVLRECETGLGSIELDVNEFEFEGEPVTPEPVVRDGNGNILRNGIDYTLSYENNCGIGTATVTATGLNGCTGIVSVDYAIKGLDLGDDFWAYMSIMGKTIYNGRDMLDDYRLYGKDIGLPEMTRSVWHFKKVPNGSYAIWSPFDDYVLDVLNYDDYDGATVQMHTYSGGNVTAQCWNVYRNGDGFGIMPMSSRTRSMCYTGSLNMANAPIQLYTTDASPSQTVQMTILNSLNSATGYLIVADRETVSPGNQIAITVSDTAYVISYKFHIVDENGKETIIDNGCNNIYEFIAEQPGTYTVYAEVSSPVSSYTGSVGRDAVIITVASPLVITSQPQDAYVENGQKAAASVTASGDGLSYQWYIKNKTSTSFSKSSVTKATYSATMSDSVDGRQMYCVVSDKYGNSVTSQTATLNKYIPLSIVTQPIDAVAENGKKTSVTVAAEGSGLSYQWYLKARTATKFSKSSIKTDTYSVTMSDAVDGRQVYCVVMDAKGLSIATDIVTLRKGIPLSITSQPKDAFVENGQKATASVVASGDELSYQWYVKNRTATKFSKSSVTKATYSVTMSDSVDGRQVYCIVTDKYGNSETSEIATLNKYIPLSIVTQPSDDVAENGQIASVSVDAEGSCLGYQWYIKNRTATKFSKSSVTKATYSVTMSDAVDGRQVYCVVMDVKGNSVATNIVALRKGSALAIVTQPQDCYVANGEKATATVVATGEGLTYQWYIKNRTATKFSKSSVTKATYNTTMSDAVDGRQVYCIVTDKYGNTVQTDTATLHKQGLSIVTQPHDVSVENGKKAAVSVVAMGEDLSYQWYIKNRTSTKFSKSSIKTDTYSVTMSDTVDGRQVYCVITDANGNTVQTNTVTLRKK